MTDTAPAPEFTPESTTETNPNAPASERQRPARQGGRGRGKAPGQRQNQNQARPERPARTVHPVLQQLFELYPKMFGAHFLPLKLGVYQELLALHPELFKREDLKVALGLHARSTRYLECVASGLARHDLNGEPVEPVAPEHVHHAIMEVFRRRQARAAQDLRPYARAQLITAIEASGLSREDYLLCVRQQDEVSTALLAEAFAELGEQAAKRDALLRTFEASGKSVAEFADMYGMDEAEVTRTLVRARQAKAEQAERAEQAAATAQNAPSTDTAEMPATGAPAAEQA
ncbi:MAG: ProQ/FINO family protein [Polaromonas sp.]